MDSSFISNLNFILLHLLAISRALWGLATRRPCVRFIGRICQPCTPFCVPPSLGRRPETEPAFILQISSRASSSIDALRCDHADAFPVVSAERAPRTRKYESLVFPPGTCSAQRSSRRRHSRAAGARNLTGALKSIFSLRLTVHTRRHLHRAAYACHARHACKPSETMTTGNGKATGRQRAAGTSQPAGGIASPSLNSLAFCFQGIETPQATTRKSLMSFQPDNIK